MCMSQDQIYRPGRRLEIFMQTIDHPPEFAPSDCTTLQLWCAHPATLRDESIEQACLAVLSDGEHKKASRYVFERHRHEYIAAQALARNALSRHEPRPPKEWRFLRGPHGKPAPEPACGLHFNLSTCEELVVCLVSREGEVGVDAEPLTRDKMIVELKDEVFTPAERAQLDQLQGAEQLDRAVSMWVLKEAYTKARGFGLKLPLQGISFLFGDEHGIRLETEPKVDEHPSSWRFCLVDYAGHRVAAVTSAPAAILANKEDRIGNLSLEVLLAQPPLNEPHKIDLPREQWFPRDSSAIG
jgi:4'-phosphopantetheinyl transferase